MSSIHATDPGFAPRPPGTLASSPSRSDAAELRDAVAQFEALLFKEAFAPLSKAMGFYGDAVVGAAAASMLRGSSTGLADSLASEMSSQARNAGSP